MGACSYWVLTGTRRYRIHVLPFRGGYVTEVWSKTWGLDQPGEVLIERRGRPNVKKVKLSDKSSVKHLAAMESEYLAACQPVIDALAMLQYEDGTPRQAGYLGIWTNGSAWVVRITDKDADAQLTMEGRTLDEALDTLAFNLGADEAPWEPCGRKKKKGT